MKPFDLLSSEEAKRLNTLAQGMKNTSLKSLFANDSLRAERFSTEFDGLFFDYSKQKVNADVMDALVDLAKSAGVKEAIEAQFVGEKINQTEGRAVLHTALRAEKSAVINYEGENVVPSVHEVLGRMERFTHAVLSGDLKGFSGKTFTDVVNIGIGGSDLGPAMVSKALEAQTEGLKAHFVSNVDGADLEAVLNSVNPETTLFIVVSKTFTTQETLANAEAAKAWFIEKAKDERSVSLHFAAVSTNLDAVSSFGIAPSSVFGFWDWVGGRYSLWSAVGLSIALSCGWHAFKELLQGAREMDNHFQTTSFESNIPVLNALLGVWNRNFNHHTSLAIIPYSQELSRFAAYLQQADMESNGKYVGRDGKKVAHQTGPVIWGEPGTNGQHAFFQLLHQGTEVIPVDFIAYIKPTSSFKDHHMKLMANCFAQSEALMNGKTNEEVQAQLEKAGVPEDQQAKIAPFKVFEGDRPSSTFLFEELTPRSLGQLIALYEHKIFVQGILWNVFSYDQWGVELGKELAKRILPVLESKQEGKFDSSTSGLIHRFLQFSEK